VSTLLVWQVALLDGKTNTLGMVRDETFVIDVVTMWDGRLVHHSKGCETPEKVEEHLRLESDGFDFVLPPTELEVPEPPNSIAVSPEFGQWIADHVMKAVEQEILHRKLASVTFTFGAPQPAFT